MPYAVGLAALGTLIGLSAANLSSGSGVSIDTSGAGSETSPAFEGPALGDAAAVIRLADFRGRPVVVNFWASWCTPCRREMPALARVHAEVGDAVAFVGINHQDNRGAALELVAETGITYPSVHDPRGDIAQDYGLLGMPTTVFLDAEGREVGRHTGELSEADLREAVEELRGSPA